MYMDSIDSPLACPVPAERRELVERLLSEPSESKAGNQPDPSECPHRGHNGLRRRGSVRGRLRFRCSGCGRTISARTGTARRRSCKDAAVWANIVRLMLEGLTLRKIVKRMKSSLWTALVWRHKLFHAMRRMTGPKLSGVVEVDETCFRLSFMGRRRGLPRLRRGRGRKVKALGISKGQVCVPAATDRRRGRVVRSACLGRVSVDDLRRMLVDPVDRDGSAPVTDGHQACARLAEARSAPCAELKGSQGRSSLPVQTVNSLHSRLKGWISRFRGVLTKRLDHCLPCCRRREANLFPALVARCGWKGGASLHGRQTEIA